MARCRGHNTIVVGDLTFCSDFDNGNLKAVEESGRSGYDFQLWTASDNCGTQYESGHSSWFHFSVAGLPKNSTIKFRMMNTKKHGGLYRSDMRPVFRSNATHNKWMRVKKSVRTDEDGRQSFEHTMDLADDVVYFAFTYPYSYATLQSELASIEAAHTNTLDVPGSIYFNRELITCSIDQRRIDLLTITASGGHADQQEDTISGLFPANGIGDAATSGQALGAAGRPLVFPGREVIIVSARVHPGEVPAQHTMRGILDLLLDPHDPRSRALRERFVFKIVPMLNPDGVFRGHFRMDQLGQNLNRYYTNPDKLKQPSIFALRRLIDMYAGNESLAMYLDLHAHASKKGCFIYGNVVDTMEDQVQNQLYCRLIAMNTPHFDYEGCLFSKDHMARTDPGDGMTAEGSSRVCTYLTHRLVHSYTLECNYNTGRIGNEVVLPEGDLGESSLNPAYRSCEFTTNPEKYSPLSWENVGQACLIAMLDIRGQNPCSRIPKTKFRTLDRIRMLAVTDVRQLSEYRGCTVPDALRRDNLAANMSRLPADKNKSKAKPGRGSSNGNAGLDNNPTAAARARAAEIMWRRFCPHPSVEGTITSTVTASRRRSSASGTSDSASAPPPERHKPKPPRQPIIAQSASAKTSGKITPRSAKVGDGKSQANISNKELSRSGPVISTPEREVRGPRPTHRGVNVPITVNELKKQLHHKLEVSASKRERGSTEPLNIDDELTEMVSTAHRGDNSALTEAMSEGTMHPPPRPLTLLLRGKGGSGMNPPSAGCSLVPTTNLLRQRYSRQRFRSDSAGSHISNDDDLEAQSEVYEENKTTSSLLASDDLSDAPVHRVYPLRASQRSAADSNGDSTTVSTDAFSTDAVGSIIVNKPGNCDDEKNVIAQSVPVLERVSRVSASPSKVTSIDGYDVIAEREKATQHIAKLMGRDITNNSPTPSV